MRFISILATLLWFSACGGAEDYVFHRYLDGHPINVRNHHNFSPKMQAAVEGAVRAVNQAIGCKVLKYAGYGHPVFDGIFIMDTHRPGGQARPVDGFCSIYIGEDSNPALYLGINAHEMIHCLGVIDHVEQKGDLMRAELPWDWHFGWYTEPLNAMYCED